MKVTNIIWVQFMTNMICDEVRKFLMGEVKIHLETWTHKARDTNLSEGCVTPVK